MTEDEMVEWHHQLDGHEFEQTQADSMLKPGMLQSMGSQRVGHNLVTEQQLLGRKGMTNLNSVLKSRDITLLTSVHIVKAILFPVVLYRCES